MVRSSSTRSALGISPQKEVRRSVREKTTVYRSLAENQLGTHVSNYIEREGIFRRVRNPGYTRSGRKNGSCYVESSEEEEAFISRRTRRRSQNEQEDESLILVSKRRRIVSEASEGDNQLNGEDENICDRVKRRHTSNGSLLRSPESKEDGETKSVEDVKNKNRVESGEDEDKTDDEKNDTERDENEKEEESTSSEEEEEEEQGRRQYPLRQRAKPKPQKNHFLRNKSRPSYSESKLSAISHSNNRREQRKDYKRRTCRSDSSSTGSSGDEERMRRYENSRFEHRKEASIMKARNRFVPINLTEKDIASSHNVIRERLRQTGASCSDVDPMGIDTSIGFEEVGGLGNHIQTLKEIVLFPMIYPDIFQNFNIKPPKGVLFYGPPGTGKTLVARALANECSRGDKKVAFFMRKGADCLSKWVGESERQLRILFDQAYSMRPSIIFFDEIDGLAPVRSTRQDQIHSSIVSTLLALMDGLDNRGEVIVIGATNRLDSIDPALRRPGRFDKELRFSLPDSAARQQILKIHTTKWGDSQPNPETLDWIAQNTSGYCGADLKYLCTESVMISLRNHYPHIYLSKDRLKLNLSEVKVTKDNILAAMKRITPASRRDFSIPCRPLDDRTSILLGAGLENILKRLPAGYRCSRNVEVTGSCELEKVVRGLEESPPISAVRIILVGNQRSPDSGQTSYVLPALLSKLDHLPVHCISISKLFADGRPEEAFATIFQAALRSAAKGPCILLCPSIDEWHKIVPISVAHMLKVALGQITGFTPILFLASSESEYEECPDEVLKMFRIQNCLAMPQIPIGIRTEYFKHIFSPAFVPPKIFDASNYIEPEKATVEERPHRHLSEEEAKELEKLYVNQLREFRIFLRDQLGKLVRDRRFTAFIDPVDKEEAEDYYEIIKEPMCFSQMQDKVDKREYTHPDQFLADIKLIVNNAVEYNPPNNSLGKTIRHNAFALRDIVEEYFEKEFDEEFVEKLEETAKLLREAKIVPQNERLLTLPEGYIRKTKWNVVTGFKGTAHSGKIIMTPKLGANRALKFHGATYNFPSWKRKSKPKATVQKAAQSLDKTPETKEEEENTPEEPLNTSISPRRKQPISQETVDCPEQSTPRKRLNGAAETPTKEATLKIAGKTLLIEKKEIEKVIEIAVKRSENWPIPELEAIAAGLANIIENYRNVWDRKMLPSELLHLIEEWDYEPRDRKDSLSMLSS